MGSVFRAHECGGGSPEYREATRVAGADGAAGATTRMKKNVSSVLSLVVSEKMCANRRRVFCFLIFVLF